MSTKTKSVVAKKSNTKVNHVRAKAPAANVAKVTVKPEPVIIQSKGRGRPTGSLSFVEVTLASLNATLNPSAIVRIDRKFSKSLNLGGTVPVAETKKEETQLVPSITTFEEPETPSNGVKSITEETVD